MIKHWRNENRREEKYCFYCIAQIAALNLLLNGGIYSEQDTPPPPLPPYSLP